MRAAFYVQNSPANLTFQRFSQLTHVWLNHGDSDKAANYSSRHATFDKIFVSGQQGVDRYAEHGVKIRPEQFAIVGRPQIEKIEVRDQLLPADAPRTVLYAPTWHGGQPATNYSSLPLGSQIVAALLKRGVTVIFRPHPHSYRDPNHAAMARQIQRQLEDDQKATGRAHVWGDQAETAWDIPDCFNHSDALITDVSSVASDFLASGKPWRWWPSGRRPPGVPPGGPDGPGRVRDQARPVHAGVDPGQPAGRRPAGRKAAGLPDQVPR